MWQRLIIKLPQTDLQCSRRLVSLQMKTTLLSDGKQQKIILGYGQERRIVKGNFQWEETSNGFQLKNQNNGMKIKTTTKIVMSMNSQEDKQKILNYYRNGGCACGGVNCCLENLFNSLATRRDAPIRYTLEPDLRLFFRNADGPQNCSFGIINLNEPFPDLF